jgi:hypothetical protein
LVAATTRTFTRTSCLPPRRTSVPSCKVRSSLDLHRQWQLADLVQEDGAAVRLLEPAGARRAWLPVKAPRS